MRSQIGGAGKVLFEVRGAAVYDDRPVALAPGSQTVAGDRNDVLFHIDLLDPAASWLTASNPPVDGRYIAYLKDAVTPGGVGIPVAKFRIHQGMVTDAEPVPLPLTILP